MQGLGRIKPGGGKKGGHRIAADVPADKPAAAVALQRLTDAPERGAVGTAGAEGLFAPGGETAELPELFSIGRRNRRRFDSQNPADGRGHQVGIQLARHRQRPVVFPEKGLHPDLPHLFGGQDLDLLLEKREDLLDDQESAQSASGLF